MKNRKDHASYVKGIIVALATSGLFTDDHIQRPADLVTPAVLPMTYAGPCIWEDTEYPGRKVCRVGFQQEVTAWFRGLATEDVANVSIGGWAIKPDLVPIEDGLLIRVSSGDGPLLVETRSGRRWELEVRRDEPLATDLNELVDKQHNIPESIATLAAQDGVRGELAVQLLVKFRKLVTDGPALMNIAEEGLRAAQAASSPRQACDVAFMAVHIAATVLNDRKSAKKWLAHAEQCTRYPDVLMVAKHAYYAGIIAGLEGARREQVRMLEMAERWFKHSPRPEKAAMAGELLVTAYRRQGLFATAEKKLKVLQKVSANYDSTIDGQCTVTLAMHEVNLYVYHYLQAKATGAWVDDPQQQARRKKALERARGLQQSAVNLGCEQEDIDAALLVRARAELAMGSADAAASIATQVGPLSSMTLENAIDHASLVAEIALRSDDRQTSRAALRRLDRIATDDFLIAPEVRYYHALLTARLEEDRTQAIQSYRQAASMAENMVLASTLGLQADRVAVGAAEASQRWIELLLLEPGHEHQALCVARQSRNLPFRMALAASEVHDEQLQELADGVQRANRHHAFSIAEPPDMATRRRTKDEARNAYVRFESVLSDRGARAASTLDDCTDLPAVASDEVSALYHLSTDGSWRLFWWSSDEVVTTEKLDRWRPQLPVTELGTVIFGKSLARALKSGKFRRLRILASGELARTPFETLILDGRPLIHWVEVTWGLDLPTRSKRTNSASHFRDSAVVLTAHGDKALRSFADAGMRIGMALDVCTDSTVVLDPDTPLRTLLSRAGNAGLLVLLTHHEMEGSALELELGLSRTDQPATDLDRRITYGLEVGHESLDVASVLRTGAVPDQAILAACVTGPIDILGLSGGLGLAHALLVAGSHEVMAATTLLGPDDALVLKDVVCQAVQTGGSLGFAWAEAHRRGERNEPLRVWEP